MHQGTCETVGDYLMMKEAAHILGISSNTLRNWNRADKLKPLRHLLNRYRLYRRAALEAFLFRVPQGSEVQSRRGRKPRESLTLKRSRRVAPPDL